MSIPEREPRFDEAVASAEPLVRKGKIAAAIVEYTKFLNWEPNHSRTLLRIAELHLKLNNIGAAVAVYEKLAGLYARDGFFLKAIAVRKKIIKVDPSNVKTHASLADLYLKQGLAVEAIEQWRALASFYERTGVIAERDRILKTIESLESLLSKSAQQPAREAPDTPSNLATPNEATAYNEVKAAVIDMPAAPKGLNEEVTQATGSDAYTEDPVAGLPVAGVPVVHTTGDIAIFLCHASEDKPAVRQLYERLQADHFQPWLDEEDLLPGQNWQHEIPRAVRRSHVVIVCLSSRSVTKSGYLQKEIKFALDVLDEQPEGIIFVIPARLEPCEVPAALSNLHYVDLYDSKGYSRLKRALELRAQQLGFHSLT